MARRRAFTLIELLIVMTVMAILIAMLTLGLKYVSTSIKTKDTHTALQTAQSLFVNYEQESHLNGLQPSAGGFSGWSGPMIAPAGSIAPGTPNLSSQQLVEYTESVMAILMTDPDNQKIVQVLPSGRTSTAFGSKTPLLLDGWGDPILFVPGNPGSGAWGLQNVTVDKSLINVLSPDSRPFFVSAGPDGVVTTGDDNIYSFQP